MTREKKSPFRHEVITRQLIQDIRSGVYPVGSQLPPELRLGEQFKASRHTVRQALKSLTDRGFIVRRASAGSMIIAAHEPRILVQSAEPMTKTLANPSDLVRRIVDTRLITVDADLAVLLQCEIGEEKLWLQTVIRSTESGAIESAANIYISAEFAGIVDHPSHQTMRFSDQVVSLYSQVIERVQVEIFSTSLPPPMPKLLGLPGGSTGLGVIRRYLGEDERIFETSITFYAGNRNVFLMELRRQVGAL
jgi:GntR family transcriptional regulator